MNFNDEISNFIEKNMDELSEQILNNHLLIENIQNFDENKKVKSLEDIKYHLQFLSNSIKLESKKNFISYILWCDKLFSSINLSRKDLIVNLKAIKNTFKSSLSEENFKIVSEYIDDALFYLNERTIFSKINENEESEKYLSLVLEGKKKDAEKYIEEKIKNGYPLEDIYINILQNAQHKIGYLWQTNKISVAQEHLATSITEYIMSNLYEYIFKSKKNGLKLISSCVTKELHQIGLRMITDILEYQGWDTTYLGANTPDNSIIDMLIKKDTDLLAISVTMFFNIKSAEKLIERIRNEKQLSKLKILVGGYPFNTDPTLYKKIGADFYAKDCKDCLKVVRENFYV
ncbi:MAG: cobalamin-dependent protein [candidate division WOR-3 bacterium]|jgi:methanogenic corrinoid protein MtbC1